jgi:hypothetical protein
VGFKPPEEEVKLFVESRNSLIHKGDFYYNTAEPRKRKKCPLSSAVEEYFFLVNFLDRVFLKLFGYSGPYMDWRQPFSPQHSTLE